MQGGFHTYLSVDAQGLDRGATSLADGLRDASLPVSTWSIQAPDGAVTVEQEHWTVADPDDAGWSTGPHLVVMQYFETPPGGGFDRSERESELEELDLELSLHVTDVCGREATAGRTVRIAFATEPERDDTGEMPEAPSAGRANR